MDKPLDLLRRALLYVTDETLAREISEALRKGGTDTSKKRRLPSWLTGVDGVGLMMIQDPEKLELDGHDPAVLLEEVQSRIDETLQDADRAAYPVEKWLRGETARYSRTRRRIDPLDSNHEKPGAPVREFAKKVSKLFGLDGTAFPDLLARAVSQHRSSDDPDGRMALRRVADGFVAFGGKPGPILLVRAPDGSGMAYVDFGREGGTIGYDVEGTRFVVTTPDDWTRGFVANLQVDSE